MNNLFILPFDHRTTFQRDLLGISTDLSKSDTAKIIELKQIVYDAFLTVRDSLGLASSCAILIDDIYGQNIIDHASSHSIPFALAVEKSGVDVFELLHGDDFGDYIQKSHPIYVKVLVRYHPDASDINPLQLKRLLTVSAFCQKNGYKFLFELLVPPSPHDLEKAGDKASYDKTIRYERTTQSLREIRRLLHVDLWKLEGVSTSQWPDILREISNDPVIVLGRGGDRSQVEQWLKAAKLYPQIVGFAVGRTIFMEPLQNFLSHKFTRDETVLQIASLYTSFIRLWQSTEV